MCGWLCGCQGEWVQSFLWVRAHVTRSVCGCWVYVCIERWNVCVCKGKLIVCFRVQTSTIASKEKEKKKSTFLYKPRHLSFCFMLIYTHVHAHTYTHTQLGRLSSPVHSWVLDHRVWMVGWMQGNSAETWGQKPGGHLRGFNSPEPWESERKHTNIHTRAYINTCLHVHWNANNGTVYTSQNIHTHTHTHTHTHAYVQLRLQQAVRAWNRGEFPGRRQWKHTLHLCLHIHNGPVSIHTSSETH